MKAQFERAMRAAEAEHGWRNADAAVLLVVRNCSERPAVLLTQRSLTLRKHPGEVALLGGIREPGDANIVATALRETREEIGLSADALQVLGPLPLRQTRAGITVAPSVALMNADCVAGPCSEEIAELFELPLHWLANPDNVLLEVLPEGSGRRYPYVFEYEGRRIWGLTAAILADFMVCGLGIELPGPAGSRWAEYCAQAALSIPR